MPADRPVLHRSSAPAAQEDVALGDVRHQRPQSDASWRFAMAAKDDPSTTWTAATARPGSVKPGAWVQLTASYERATGHKCLHIDGKDAASAADPTPVKATGAFRIVLPSTVMVARSGKAEQLHRCRPGPQPAA
jgi:hypothetical protein